MSISTALVEYLLFDNLRYFQTSGKSITRDTPFEQVLAPHKVGASTPRTLFRDVSRHDILINGGSDKPWPGDWISLSCAKLAPSLT